MVAAGSNDPLAARDLAVATAHLAEAWRGPVRLATLTGLGHRPADVLRPGDVVSPYLLAPGHFHDRCRAAAADHLVAGVIGAHPAVVDLVVERAVAALQRRAGSLSRGRPRARRAGAGGPAAGPPSRAPGRV
jgi:hypothetical protein